MVHIGILGGGPIGVEMALAALRSGHQVTLIERGSELFSNVLSWGHVTLFSPNNMNMSQLGRETLEGMKVNCPKDEDFPTGLQYIQTYLAHLAAFLKTSGECSIHLRSKVLSVGRHKMMKSDLSKERSKRKFRILIEKISESDKVKERIIDNVDVVVDATGTYGNHNYVGNGGIPALGEISLGNDQMISYIIPDVSKDVDKYAGAEKSSKHSMVIGCGASAITTLSSLKSLGLHQGGVSVTWVTKRFSDEEPFRIIENDPLPQREALYQLGNDLAKAGASGKHVDGFEEFKYKDNCFVTKLEKVGDKIEVTLEDLDSQDDTTYCHGPEELDRCKVTVDNVIACVGYRPDTSLTRELQVHYCYATEGPMRLAASLLAAGGAGGDCLAQEQPGDGTLLSPEPGVFIIGMKSYGRGSAFLLRLGHQQVEAVLRLIQQHSTPM